MQSPGDIGAEEVQPESGRHRRRSHTRQGPRRPPTPAGRPEPGGPARTEESCPGEESPDRHHSMGEERKKRALWEREPDQPHEETHGLGAAVRKIEGDTPRRAKSQPNSCVSLEGNPRRCTELFVLGIRLTLASHGDLDVGAVHAILRPLKEVTAAVANGSRRDVDLGDILWSRTGRWMEDR